MENTTIVVIIQIASLVITIASIWINYYLTVKENKKARMVEITIKQRLSDMENTKKAYTSFLTYINPAVIKVTPKEEYVLNLWHSYNELASLLKINYSQDIELLQLSKKMCGLVTSYIETQDSKLETEIIDLSDLLYELYSLYTYSNWVCIKEQAYGTELKSIDYKKIYDEKYNDFVKRI